MENRARQPELAIHCCFVNRSFVKGFLDRSGLKGSRLNRSGGN